MELNKILDQIEIDGEFAVSKSTGKRYHYSDFLEKISKQFNLKKKDKDRIKSHFVDTVKVQSENSINVEKFIKKYNFQFADGIYLINGEIYSIDDVYKFLWKNEQLLPTEANLLLENIEKISENVSIQGEIFEKIKLKAVPRESKYLKSLDEIYGLQINFRDILFNILTPNSKPLFHVFYDDGIGGTGKSTLLEVITKIVGEKYTSNVLLDQFGNRFIFANMLGKYVNIGDDNGKNDELQNVGTLKSIVTGNRVTIDRKGISPIEVRIFAKQIFATNILPYIDFTDGGIMRRLNIVKMNAPIPSWVEMCTLDDDEVGAIVHEVLTKGRDLTDNRNELAIETSPLYRFFTVKSDTSYDAYKSFCDDYGFKKLNIINFESKARFIKSYINRRVEQLMTK